MKTKVYFLTILSVLFFCNQNANAQFKYGFQAGMNVQTQSEIGQLWNNNDFYSGFLAGGFFEYQVKGRFSVQTELNYQQKGQKYNNTLEGIKTVTNKEYDYLTIPILFKGTFGSELGLSDKWNVTGFAGPYAAYLTSANSTIKTGSLKTNYDLDDQAEKSDWGVIMGGGLLYHLNNGGAIVTELRYEMGLGQIDENDKNIRNKVVGLSVGYRF